MANITTPATTKAGWVPSPNGRGTLDIIWSCMAVLIIAIWSVMHINVPREGAPIRVIILHKIGWAILLAFAPESIMLIASVQWESARASKRDMNSLGYHHWTTVHGFFADSGGLMLEPPDFPAFPINSRALYYLAKNHYIQVPNISREEINDRSNADRLGKFLALMQSSYLTCQVIARAIQGLEITCLEITTMAFLLCTAFTYWFWTDKPLDIETSLHIRPTVTMREILIAAGPAAQAPYDDTPMDFVEQPGWRAWRRRKVFRTWGGLKERPIRRIPNDYSRTPTFGMAILTWIITVVHATIHVVAWNHEQPTRAEQMLWQGGSLCLLLDLFVWGAVEVLSVKPGLNFTMTILGVWEKKTTKPTLLREWAFDGPATVSAIMYFISKAILLAVSFSSLRQQPTSVFETVEWTDLWPHV